MSRRSSVMTSLSAQVQVGIDACFERLGVHLKKAWPFPRQQEVGRHAGQRLATPQRKRPAHLFRRVAPPGLPRCLPCSA